MKEIFHTAGAVGTIAVGEVSDYVADYLDQVEGHEEPVLSHEVVKEPEVDNPVPEEVNQQETVSDVNPMVESAPVAESAPSVVNDVASATSSEVVVPEGVSNEDETASKENETASNSNSNETINATENETPSNANNASSTDATAASPEAVSPATQTNEEAPKESAPAEETTPKSNSPVC